MYNPRKINLYLENELPVLKTKEKGQSGGTINTKLINNKTHKYIRAEHKIKTFIYGAPKIEEDVQLWFEFNHEYMHPDSENENCYYMERTSNSLSFSIKQLKKYSNVTVKDMPTDILTLKLVELTYKNIDTFIEDWKTNKEILGESIPNIYMYGDLYTKEGTFICNYYITQKYKNHISTLKLDYDQTIKYIIKMLLFVEKCNENNLVLRNFKFSGLGYNFINSEINFVLLDYNDTTLIKKNENYFKTFSDGCDAMCAGTLVPYFIIYDFFEMNSEWINKLDKLYVVGLAEALVFLLYNQDEIMESLFKMLYNPSYLKPCLHYYHYMKLFDDNQKKSSFMELLNSLQVKFVELDPKFINPMFKRIIINCFETKYNAIKSPATYLNHLKKVYGEYNELKATIKTYIKPIDTLEEANTQKPIYELPKDNYLKEQKLQKQTFIKDKTQIRETPSEKDDLLKDYDLRNIQAKIELDNPKELLREETDLDKDEEDTDLDKDEEDTDLNKDEEETDLNTVQEEETVTEDLKDLERFIESDDMIDSGDFIPVNPNVNEKPLKPILKQENVASKIYKKVGFADEL